MVHVRLERTGRESLRLTLTGHAGAAPAGEDTVCAAASMLAYTVAQEVLEMQSAGKLRRCADIKMEKGEAQITCRPKRNAWREALHLYRVAQTGYRLLAANFPGHVQVTTF